MQKTIFKPFKTLLMLGITILTLTSFGGLSSPSISFNDSTLELSWKHVEGATQYELYSDGSFKATYYVAGYQEAGDYLDWYIGGYVSRTHDVKIKAKNSDKESGYSNTVKVKC